ncbi:MAG: hypothetical protein F2735_08630 [Actinobacteria bacterium]|uniref:Unannotated protein n=1 Tax=freshwater metagenome TaxID=449393 RepID=A0A6J6YWL4_9ZZZZ|nr:hypothetical protein [Actinomycetota bacterium]
MLANEAAFDTGNETVDCIIDGIEYSQGTFAYQKKCIVWLREQYTALTSANRAAVDAILAGTGCEALFDH